MCGEIMFGFVITKAKNLDFPMPSLYYDWLRLHFHI